MLREDLLATAWMLGTALIVTLAMTVSEDGPRSLLQKENLAIVAACLAFMAAFWGVARLLPGAR